MPDTPTLSPVRLLAEGLRREASRPLVTYYDDATGERTELSRATFDNWVAKTANLLVDGLGAGAGTRVALLLPLHWQTAVWLAAGWSAGVTVCMDVDAAAVAANADVAVCGPDSLDAALVADEVVALSLRAWGAPFVDPLPGGVLDYAGEVASYGDRFAPRGPVGEVTEIDGTTWSGGALMEAAADAAARWSLAPGGRLLTTREPTTLDGVLALLPVALAVDGSVVLARGYGDDVADRLSGERITATAR